MMVRFVTQDQIDSQADLKKNLTEIISYLADDQTQLGKAEKSIIANFINHQRQIDQKLKIVEFDDILLNKLENKCHN